MSFENKLGAALDSLGWDTLRFVVELREYGADVSHTAVYKWLNGKSEPGLGNAQATVKCLRAHGIDDFSIDPPYAGNSTEAAV